MHDILLHSVKADVRYVLREENWPRILSRNNSFWQILQAFFRQLKVEEEFCIHFEQNFVTAQTFNRALRERVIVYKSYMANSFTRYYSN
jgi:uncharacterized protein with ParB-like and HNH nuclease domain